MVERKSVHPNGTCNPKWSRSTVHGMEQTWNISGADAEWSMTVAQAPDPEVNLPDWPQYHFEGLARHFADLVDQAEASALQTQ
jgi:hypothetical protein